MLIRFNYYIYSRTNILKRNLEIDFRLNLNKYMTSTCIAVKWFVLKVSCPLKLVIKPWIEEWFRRWFNEGCTTVDIGCKPTPLTPLPLCFEQWRRNLNWNMSIFVTEFPNQCSNNGRWHFTKKHEVLLYVHKKGLDNMILNLNIDICRQSSSWKFLFEYIYFLWVQWYYYITKSNLEFVSIFFTKTRIEFLKKKF